MTYQPHATPEPLATDTREALPVVAYLLLDQGRRAIDDVEDYERVELVADLPPSEVDRFDKADRLEKLCRLSDAEAEIARLRADAAALSQWKAAIDEALIVSCLDCIGPNDEPEATLARLISWEVAVALDPAVSQAAADLLTRRFTAEQRTDLLAAALYLSAHEDETSVLSRENAERISELLYDLSGFDLDAAIDKARSATSGEAT